MDAIYVERLASLKLAWPRKLPSPGGLYTAVRCGGGLAAVAAQFPIDADGLTVVGRIGVDLDTARARHAAALAAVNVLAQLDAAIGLPHVAALLKFEAFLVTTPEWDEFPRVLDGASEVFQTVMGEEVGRHARALCGVAHLPRGFALELTALAVLAR